MIRRLGHALFEAQELVAILRIEEHGPGQLHVQSKGYLQAGKQKSSPEQGPPPTASEPKGS